MNGHRTYLVVFLGEFRGNKIYDKGGDDPCFCDPPTWGICRPNVRKYLKVGDTLFFLAKIESEYYLKGWFDVGEKIDYVAALNGFATRQNVIILGQQNPRVVFWKDKALEKCYRNRHNNGFPMFLSELNTRQGAFYQNHLDRHKIDNWKCRRILNCNSKELAQCAQNNSCEKSGVDINDDKYKNYIVANKNKWDDVDYLRITLADIRTETGFNKAIITLYHQHNPLKFDEYKDKLFCFINQQKNKYQNSLLLPPKL